MAEKKQRKNTGKKEKAKKIEKKIEKKGRIEEKPPVQAGFLKTYKRPLVFLSIFALSLIFLVSNLGMAGIVGKWLKSLNFGLFGFFAWLMPLYVVLITALLLLGEKEWKMKLRIFLSFFVLHFFMAIGELVSYPLVAEMKLSELYLFSAKNGNGGGFFGGLLAKFLATGLAVIGSYIVLFFLIVIVFVLMTGNFFVEPVSRRAKELWESIVDLKEEKIEEARKTAEMKRDVRQEARNFKRVERAKRNEVLRERRKAELTSRYQPLSVNAFLEKWEREKEEERQRLAKPFKEDLEPIEEVFFEEKSQIKEERLIKEEKPITEDGLLSSGSEEAKDRKEELFEQAEEKLETEANILETEEEEGEDELYEIFLKEKFGSGLAEEERGKELFLADEEKKELSWQLIEETGLSQADFKEDDRKAASFFEEIETSHEEDFSKESNIAEEEDLLTEASLDEEEKFFLEEEEISEEEELLEYESLIDEEDMEEETIRLLSDILNGEGTSKKEEVSYSGSSQKVEVRETREVEEKTEKIAEPRLPVKEEEITEVTKEVIELKKAYAFPPLRLLRKSEKSGEAVSSEELSETAEKLQKTLEAFGVRAKVTDLSCGSSVTRYELQPEIGVKVSRITSLADDIKLNLAAADIRIEAPIPGKAAVGIEVPNKTNTVVSFRDLIESKEFTDNASKLSFAVGKDIGGKTMVTDIAKMPHLLIAGATGSGKSVCINTLIMSILYKASPSEVKFIMIDPKVVELSVYNGIPHLLLPVVTDPKKAAAALNWAVAEMNRRYGLFAEKGVRNLKGYNKVVETSEEEKLTQIVIIVDELADLMMVSSKDVEEAICRLAQLARAAGIHLVIATQRPSVNVITGLIKANIPSRIAFAVSSQVDSRTILDGSGAEKLLGKGDMLFFPSGYPKPVRVQGAFVSDEEVAAVADFIRQHEMEEGSLDITEAVNQVAAEGEKQAMEKGVAEPSDDYDEYFDEAGLFIIEKQKASIGMLQRVYRIGFNRAARIMDQLAEAQVVSEEDGTRARKILMTKEDFLAFLAFRHGEEGGEE